MDKADSKKVSATSPLKEVNVVDRTLYSSRYILKECEFCSQKNLIIFGLGEPNPNRFVCKIAGVWSYEEK